MCGLELPTLSFNSLISPQTSLQGEGEKGGGGDIEVELADGS
jgi:hypothetical protein